MKPFRRLLLLHTKIKTQQTLITTLYIYIHYYIQPDIAPPLKQITEHKIINTSS